MWWERRKKNDLADPGKFGGNGTKNENKTTGSMVSTTRVGIMITLVTSNIGRAVAQVVLKAFLRSHVLQKSLLLWS